MTKYRILISATLIGFFWCIGFNFLWAQDKVYRIKRSGENALPAPSAPAPEATLPSEPEASEESSVDSGLAPMGSIPPIKSAPRAPAMLYKWQHDRTKTVKTQVRKQPLVAPSDYIIHEVFDSILRKYVNKHGWVDYRGLKRDKRAVENLNRYVTDLAKINPSTLTDPSDRITAWLNLYNAMVLQELLKNYPVKNVMRIPDFYGKRQFKVGDKEYSLIEIDREIFMKEIREPRTVLARVNGASSGPRFMREAFSVIKLEKQLEDRTWKFLLDRNNVDFEPRTKTLILNTTFLWYQEEFGDILPFLQSYLDLIPTVHQITYRGYDWALNDEKLH